MSAEEYRQYSLWRWPRSVYGGPEGLRRAWAEAAAWTAENGWKMTGVKR